MDLSCSTGHYPNERAVSSVQAPRGRSFAEMAPCVCRKPARPCAWGWHVKMHSSLSPITGALCSFPANKSVVWPHPVTVSAAPWQAPGAAPVLRAWGRCLGQGPLAHPSPHSYGKAAGHFPAATQILQARWSNKMHF